MLLSQKEYNRLLQQKHREEEKHYKSLYQDSSVSGISFTEFVRQQKEQERISKWQKLSILLSDEELKMEKLSFKLSDQNLRKKFKGGNEV